MMKYTSNKDPFLQEKSKSFCSFVQAQNSFFFCLKRMACRCKFQCRLIQTESADLGESELLYFKWFAVDHQNGINNNDNDEADITKQAIEIEYDILLQQNDDFDEDEWTIRKAAACSLELLANVSDDILKYIV